MLNKVTVAVFGVLAIILAILGLRSQTRENFGAPFPMTFKVDRVASPSPQAAYQGDFYSVPGTYQAILSPRFSNTDYGAQIRYNMPSYEMQGVPKDPLTFGNVVGNVKEGFCGSCGGCGCGPSCNKGGISYMAGKVLDANYAATNYNEMKGSLKYTDVTDMLPVGDMKNGSGPQQPIVYDRFIYAPQRSRLYGLGDPIRGDLAIVPCGPGWFRPSVQPNIDLRDGAMMVMGGVDNDTAKQTQSLMMAAAGGLDRTFGGINYNDVNMATQRQMGLTAAGGDIGVTSFP